MTAPPDLAYLATHAPPDHFWPAALLAGALALFAAWQALRHWRHLRIVEDTPTALIRSAPQGYIELRGMAELMDGDPIHAPLSLRRCAWFQYKVEHYERAERHGHRRGGRWVTVERGVSDHLFHLVDTSGRCAIDPDGATVTPGHVNVWYGSSRRPGGFNPADGTWWARALGRLGSRYRYTERRIEPGDALFAIGNFMTHGGGGGDRQAQRDAAVAERLREWKRDRQRLLREFDANGDGQVDLDEWSRARARAEAEVAASRAHAVIDAPPVDVLGRTGDRRRPFIIAGGTEDVVIRRASRAAAVSLCVAVPLLCATLWLISLRLATP
jgi:hypothetical protein